MKKFMNEINEKITNIIPDNVLFSKVLNVIISLVWAISGIVGLAFLIFGENTLFFPYSQQLESGNFWGCCFLGAGVGVFLDIFCLWGLISILTIPALFWVDYKSYASKVALVPTCGMVLALLVSLIMALVKDFSFGNLIGYILIFLLLVVLLLILSIPAFISDSFVRKEDEFIIIPMFLSALALALGAGLLAFVIATAFYFIWVTIILVILIGICIYFDRENGSSSVGGGCSVGSRQGNNRRGSSSDSDDTEKRRFHHYKTSVSCVVIAEYDTAVLSRHVVDVDCDATYHFKNAMGEETTKTKGMRVRECDPQYYEKECLDYAETFKYMKDSFD